MTDITDQVDQFTKGMLIMNSPDGLLLGGPRKEQFFHRRYSSKKMKDENGDEFIWKGKIFWNDNPKEQDRYYIVYEYVEKVEQPIQEHLK